MKYAAAMKYGGELINAMECDYASFKEMIPLCPNCKEPVFLRQGGDRLSQKGTKYKINSHWCHFKGTTEEQIAACENRVNGYTSKERQKIASKARNQRLSMIQRWFWRVFNKYLKSNQKSFEFIPSKLEPPSNLKTPQVQDIFRAALKHSAQQLKDKSFYGKLNNPETEIFLQGLVSEWEPNRFDLKIASEVFEFLASTKNQSLLYDACAIVMDIQYQAQVFILEAQGMSNDQAISAADVFLISREMLKLVALGIDGTICSIPWAHEFQLIEVSQAA